MEPTSDAGEALGSDPAIDITSGPEPEEEINVAELLGVIRQQAAAQQNVAVRHRQDVEEAERRGTEAVLRGIIPRLDELIVAVGDSEEGDLDAVQGIFASLLSDLRRFGLTRVGLIGEKFDPNIHEVFGVSEQGGEHHAIERVVRSGWLADGRLLRPAGVIVVVKNGDSPAQ